VILINAEANYEITNNANQTPYRLAEILGLDKVIKLLKSLSFSAFNLPDRSLVTELMLHGSTTALRQLLKKHPNLVHEYKDLNFFVMIQEKMENDKALSMAEVLISENADINGPRGLQKNPLITAVVRGNLDFVKFFLKHNADLLIYDVDGKTALYHAVEKNQPEMVKALVSKNAQKRYTYIDTNGRRRSANVCNVARALRPTLTTSEDKGKNESIMDELGCGLRWLF
jgi:ankyrin repeat protein